MTSPIRHHVKSHQRKNVTVRDYERGSGSKVARFSGDYISNLRRRYLTPKYTYVFTAIESGTGKRIVIGREDLTKEQAEARLVAIKAGIESGHLNTSIQMQREHTKIYRIISRKTRT